MVKVLAPFIVSPLDSIYCSAWDSKDGCAFMNASVGPFCNLFHARLSWSDAGHKFETYKRCNACISGEQLAKVNHETDS